VINDKKKYIPSISANCIPIVERMNKDKTQKISSRSYHIYVIIIKAKKNFFGF
jgi:hypothetical protein